MLDNQAKKFMSTEFEQIMEPYWPNPGAEK